LHICFAVAEIVILGSGLRRLAEAVQTGSLKSARRISQNYAPALQTNIISITVTRKELA
jgi:cation transport ATPase